MTKTVEFRWADGRRELVEISALPAECWVPVPREPGGKGPAYRPAVFVRVRTEDGHAYEEVTLQ